MDSPVKSTAALTSTGSAVGRPCYLKGVWVVSTGSAGAVTCTDGSGGATVFDIDSPAGASGDMISIPGRGIRCESTLHLSALTNVTSVTFFYE